MCALFRVLDQYIWFLFLANGRYAGERDKFGRIHGRGTVYFPNGRKFVGSFSHGARCGGGELFEREGARILSGTYVHDRLSGHCEISTNEGGAMEYTFARGVASGPVRRFSPTGFLQGRLFKIYNQNVPVNSSVMDLRYGPAKSELSNALTTLEDLLHRHTSGTNSGSVATTRVCPSDSVGAATTGRVGTWARATASGE